MAKSLRDLLQGEPHPSEELTIRDVAAPDEPAVYEDPDDPKHTRYARVPGDPEDHPELAKLPKNPMPGMGPIEMFKALTEGRIPPAKERAVRAWLSWVAK